MSKYEPWVIYTYYTKIGDGNTIEDYCYSSLKCKDNIVRVTTDLKVDKSIDDETLKKFIKFSSVLLDPSFFKVDVEEDILHVDLNCSTFKDKYSRILIYLSYFRYAQEFPYVIVETFSGECKDDEEIYNKFFAYHTNSIMHKKYTNSTAHGLIPAESPYQKRKEVVPLSVVKERMRGDYEYGSVVSYFV